MQHSYPADRDVGHSDARLSILRHGDPGEVVRGDVRTFRIPHTSGPRGVTRLAVIPARGGSKRVPRKNVRPFAGRPMIAHTIRAAVEAAVFDSIVVSTDDPEIADVARTHGAEVPFLRDAGLADDHTPVSAATRDALQRLDPDGGRFTSVAQLMPNCPLRGAEDVCASLATFEAGAHPSQISVTRYGWLNPWWALTTAEDGSVREVFADRLRERSQDLPTLVCPTGAIWWIDAETLRREGTFHLRRRGVWELPWRRAIDIDDEDDLALAALLARAASADPAT